ncbi:hypothetical protein [Methanobacterium subterraneum]|uniref:hypothetical protein n=1 Tax=Methanobacterium subterraneum TaxID=59277 RepID=UPI00194EF5D0|nr:hypothetical protein [Methanobacterium subterraneum]
MRGKSGRFDSSCEINYQNSKHKNILRKAKFIGNAGYSEFVGYDSWAKNRKKI